MARTAVVAGTASAVSGRVQRRQASRFADRDAEIAAKQQQAYQAQMGQQQAVYQEAAPPLQPPAAGGISNEAIAQLKELGALKAQGILTEEEFSTQKAKILGG
ncbi:SHOCT domain-containing protein [Micrococcaceae bacterium Sec5.8]